MSRNDIWIAYADRHEDYDALIALLNKSEEYFNKISNETRGPNAPQEKPYKFTEDEFHHTLVLYMKDKGKPFSCLCIRGWYHDTPVVILDNLWVEPEYRRMSYGRKLVETAMDMIHKAERHAELVILTGNVGASAFWYNIMPDMVKMHTYYYLP